MAQHDRQKAGYEASLFPEIVALRPEAPSPKARPLEGVLRPVAARREDAPSPTERPLEAILNNAYDMMAEHGLEGWRVRFDHARRRAGQCDYTRKTISLSRHYARYAETSHIQDTILHEIAHALVGPQHGHDAVWRQMARKIGCSATRCHSLTFSRPRWVMKCPKGCFMVERHRRSSRMVCMKCKTAVEFIPNHDLL